MARRTRPQVVERIEYDISDVEAVYRYVKPTRWEDLLEWLRREEQSAGQAGRIRPGEALAMREDFERLQKAGKPFPSTAQELWRMVKGR